MKILKKIILPVLFVLVLIGLDRFTKYIAYTNLPENPVPVIDGVFEFRYLENTGAAFGMLKDSRILFIAVTVIVIALLVFAYIKLLPVKKFTVLRVLDLFIIGGALGNFIDRVFQGYVVDFMYISLIDFPIFNLADIFVSWSAVLAAILIIFKFKDSDFKELKINDK